ncbi:MAG: hypothetical protein QGD94_11710 [Planctomycetia bacterium]|nr:hypothetical protein [Planctomycetia bacterium]
MSIVKCPGQDQRFWKPGDIYEIACLKCGNAVEFWKDDPVRPCKSCGFKMRNPKLDLACAEWCKFADKCLGVLAADDTNKGKSGGT